MSLPGEPDLKGMAEYFYETAEATALDIGTRLSERDYQNLKKKPWGVCAKYVSIFNNLVSRAKFLDRKNIKTRFNFN